MIQNIGQLGLLLSDDETRSEEDYRVLAGKHPNDAYHVAQRMQSDLQLCLTGTKNAISRLARCRLLYRK